jgi:acyl carrier protein phosphodiesterase
VHNSLLSSQEFQPLEMKNMVKSMIEHKWLMNYIFFWGVEKAFKSLNTRIKIKNIDLTLCIPVLKDNYLELEQHFLEFYPSLRERTEDFLKNSFQQNGQ